MATTSGISSTAFTVDPTTGKLNVSGIASGIDSTAIINALIAAKRQPAVDLETKITANTSKISALQDFKTKMLAVTTALDKLRGNPGSTTSVFDSKSISGTTTAVSGTPSDIDSLVIASVSNTAQNISHTIKINSLASAQQIRSDSVSSTTATLSSLGIAAGDLVIGGKTITISSTDTLLDLKSKINNAGAGVTASIVSSDASTNYLVLTASNSGTANAIAFSGSTAVSNALGLTTTNTTTNVTSVKNQLTAAQDANLDVDGITGITRSTNNISDIISGVTLSLLKAEPGTTINLAVAPDLTAIKSAMNDFVTAYNDVRSFVTAQRTPSDLNKDGTVDDDEVGPLAYDATVRSALSKLSDMASASIPGATDGFASLGQVGIVVQSDYTLALDDTVLDPKLLANVDGLKTLFAFGGSVSDSRATILAQGTNAPSGTYTLNIGGTDADGNVTSATFNGVAMTVSGKTLTAADGTKIFFNGGANLGAVSGITVTMSSGIADQNYDFFNGLTTTSSGTIDTQVTQLQTQDTDYKTRVDDIDDRLKVTRTNLEAKYTAMETAMAKLQTLQQTIQSYSDSLNQSSN